VMKERGVIKISVLFITKRQLAAFLLVMVICTSVIGIFNSSLTNAAVEVVSVLIAGGKIHPIYAVDIQEKKIAISFDATWGSTRTQTILNTLAKYEIKTTFFLTNIWLEKYPDLAREIARQGHEIGLHSATHLRMTDLSDEKALQELEDNAALITEITGQKPVLFRPPFGAYNNRIVQLVQEAGYVPIQWSIDSLDWKNLSADEIYRRVTTKMAPGAIILFHNDGANTPEALERILEYLKKEGYEVVPISDLIYKDNYYIDNNGIQKLRPRTEK